MNTRRIALLLVFCLALQMLVGAFAPARANIVGNQGGPAELFADPLLPALPMRQEFREPVKLPEYFHDYHFLPFLLPDPEWQIADNWY